MKFQIKTIVEGDFFLKEPITSRYGKYTIAVFIEDGRYKLSVTRDLVLKDPLSLRYRITGENSGPIPPCEDDYADIIDILHHIEAFGGLNYGITKIYYNEHLEFIWLSQDNTGIYTPIVVLNRTLPKHKPKCLSQKNISSILELKRLIPDAKIAYNYFRIANRFMQAMDYIPAYTNFYKVLEYSFAEGTFTQNEHINHFKKSDKLIFAILSTLDVIRQPQFEKTYNWLLNEWHEKYERDSRYNGKFKYLDELVVINILVKSRGLLSHASYRTERYQFDSHSLHPLVHLISSICFMVCCNMQVYCMSNPKWVTERLHERIAKLRAKLGIDSVQ